jgi:hypothetical protein
LTASGKPQGEKFTARLFNRPTVDRLMNPYGRLSVAAIRREWTSDAGGV